MNKSRRLISLILALALIMTFTLTNETVSSAATKKISVKLNPMAFAINGKTVKIDSFEYSGKYYIQMQDVCSYLGIDYAYATKAKTITVFERKPAKAVSPAKLAYSSYKPKTVKSVSAQESPLTIKINNKTVKLQHYLIGSSAYFTASDIAAQLIRDYRVDTKLNTLFITDKKPPLPVLKPSTTAVTDKDVLMTVENWGNAVKKEYRIDEGSWLPYTVPVAVPYNGFFHARGTNAANIASDVAKLEIGNIRKLKNKVDISKLSKWAVKIITYDINGNQMGTGSGCIISADGRILTNFHVIDMIPQIKVVTYDDKVYDVLGITAYDASKDIAILKINALNLPTAVLGNSDSLELGEEIVTFGYPLGKGITVTFGNVSSLTSSPGIFRNSDHDIQISAPISPGNSGGPLLNMFGEVVGINYSTLTNAQNMNNSIPINEVKPLLAANTLKSLETVTSEAYPVMDIKDYEYYLFYNYEDLIVEDYYFSFNNIFLVNGTTDPNQLFVEVDMGAFQYGEVLLAEFEGNRDCVEVWAEDIYQKVKKKFPEREVYVAVCLSGSFSVYPSGYTSDQIEYDSETGMYDIFKEKLWYGYQNGQVYRNWLY